jgi:uncharacterized SAM-binding protein YcdF (DUF218 family)
MILIDFFRLLGHVILLPPASLFAGIAIGWLLHFRWPRAGKTVSGLSLLILFVLSTPAGADLLVAPLEGRTMPLTSMQGTGAEAIVLLAAGRLQSAPEYGMTHVPDYIALARMRYAARLQHATNLPILVTGGNRSRDAIHDSKAASIARALREDFRTPVMWVEEEAETTAENATRSLKILQAHRIHRILLVTDAMHMPRSEAMFRAAGLDVVPAPTVFLGRKNIDFTELLPSAEALRCSYYAAYEWIGILWYRLQ